MLKNPHDARARRTEEMLRSTLLQLLREKPLRQITVAEVCRLCRINRATFYDHYADVYALYEAVEDAVLADLQTLMKTVEPAEEASEDVSTLFFSFLQTHRTVLQRLLSGENSVPFFRKLDAAILPFFEKKVRQNYAIPDEYDAVQLRRMLQFLTAGYYAFFAQSLRDGAEDETELARLAVWISDCCLTGKFGSSFLFSQSKE